MAWILHNAIDSFRRKGSSIFLAFSFFIGILIGIYLFRISEPSFLSLMRRCFVSPVSIVRFLSCAILPFLLSATAVLFSRSWLIYLISVTEAMLFSYTTLEIIFAFYPVGYFIRFLLLLGDCLSLPVLYFFWRNSLLHRSHTGYAEILLFLSIGFLIGCAELYIVSFIWTGIL